MNLKLILMRLGNRLVQEYGWEPGYAGSRSMDDWLSALDADSSTAIVILFTHWLNVTPDARQILADSGVDWRPVAEKKNVDQAF